MGNIGRFVTRIQTPVISRIPAVRKEYIGPRLLGTPDCQGCQGGHTSYVLTVQ